MNVHDMRHVYTRTLFDQMHAVVLLLPQSVAPPTLAAANGVVFQEDTPLSSSVDALGQILLFGVRTLPLLALSGCRGTDRHRVTFLTDGLLSFSLPLTNTHRGPDSFTVSVTE